MAIVVIFVSLASIICCHFIAKKRATNPVTHSKMRRNINVKKIYQRSAPGKKAMLLSRKIKKNLIKLSDAIQPFIEIF